MKTSKKILSLILAVVLVVTTCSVGFTAFAADSTTESYWTDKNKTDADDAFQSLNNIVDFVVPTLLNIKIDGATLASKLGITNPDSASLSDIVKGASPLLMNVLGIAKASDQQKKDIIMEHLKVKSYNGVYDKYFSYLENKDAQISFFDLYQFCKDNKTSSTDTTTLGGWCNQTIGTLDTYLNLYDTAMESVSTSETAYAKLKVGLTVEKTATKKLGDIAYADLADSTKNPDSYKDYAQGVENANNFFKKMGVDLKITNPAEALFYFYADEAADFVNGIIVVHLASGKISDAPIASSATNLTTANVMDILSANVDAYIAANATFDESYSIANFIADHEDMITKTGVGSLAPVKNMTAAEAQAAGYAYSGKYYDIDGWPVHDPNAPTSGSGTDRFFYYVNPTTKRVTRGQRANAGNVTSAQTAIAAPYFEEFKKLPPEANIVDMYGKMLKDCYMDIKNDSGEVENTNLGVYNSTVYTTLVENALAESGLYTDAAKAINDAKITDEQIKAASDFAIKNGIDTNDAFQSFVASEDCKFSAGAKNVIASIKDATTNQALANALNNKDNLGNASTKSAVELFKEVVYDVAPYNQQGAKTFYDVVNLSVSSVMLYNFFGTDRIGISSALCQSGSKTANVPVIYKEMYRYQIVEPKLNDENNKYNYTGSIVIPDTFSVDLVNTTLNTYIDMALKEGGEFATFALPILNALTESIDTNDLYNTVHNIWKKLAENPIETVFELLPVVVIVVDELLVPILFNQPEIKDGALAHDKDAYYNLVYDAAFAKESLIQIPKLQALTLEAGNTKIGISQMSFDLNAVLPGLLEWLKYNNGTEEGKATAFAKANAFINTYADRGYATINEKDDEGNILKTVDGSKILSFTGIYVADKALMDFSISAIKNDNKDLETGLEELLVSIVDIADTVVLDYVKEQEKNPSVRYTNDGYRSTEGLNDVLVALPQLIDGIGKGLLKKYNVKSDWAYCFEDKIYEDKHKKATEKTVLRNESLQMFKEASSDKSADILETFVNIFIGHQLNAFIDLFNDILSDPNNTITSNVPLVQSLVMSLGGLGEESIITDVLDGLFQLKRADDVSFEIAERETGFVGFSTESGIYLIANLFSQKADATNSTGDATNSTGMGLVPFIINLVKKDETPNQNTNNTPSDIVSDIIAAATAPSAPYLTLSSKNAKYNETLTKENINKTQELITKLDNLLASLLKDTTINGFDLSSTDGILSGVISTISNYIGNANTKKLLDIVDQYLNVVVADNESSTTGKVDANKVYTSEKLSSLVIETYCFINDMLDYVLNDALKGKDPNGILTDAICGIISPDAVGLRMTKDYKTTAKILLNKDNVTWADVKANNPDLKFNISKGSKEDFYHALGESVNGIATIIGVLLTESYTSTAKTDNYYSAILYPVLTKLANATGAPAIMSPSAFNKATDAEKLVDGIILPLSNLLNQLYQAPASFLINLIKGLAGVLEDNSIKSVVAGAIDPIKVLLNGVVDIVKPLSPTLAKYLGGIIDEKVLSTLDLKLPAQNIFVNLITNIKISGIPIGSYVAVESLDLSKLANAKTPAEALLIVYTYLVDTVTKSNIFSLLGMDSGLADELNEILSSLSASIIISLLSDAVSACTNPREIYWTFREYAFNKMGKFSYPKNISEKQAEKSVKQIDGIVNGVFPLLNELKITDIESLSALVNDGLYTNAILTTIATAIYGGIEKAVNGNETVKNTISGIGMDVSPNGLAKYLVDTSYGTTFSSAAQTLKAAKTWADVKTINWGFTDGSAKAQTGFINGLAALARPINQLLSIFLAQGTITPEQVNILSKVITVLDIKVEKDIFTDKKEYAGKIKLTVKNAQLTLVIDSNKTDKDSVVNVDLKSVIKALTDASNNFKLSTNGYESAIVPILEAFMCKDIKTYSQYKSDVKAAKDNLVIDILNPIFGLVNDVVANPIDTVTKILPNVAYFLSNNGLIQAIGNLLQIPGLTVININGIIYPLVSMLLKDNLNITLPEFTFEAIASHGTLKTGVPSAARNADGKFITEQIVADQGEVLISVLRYVADFLIKNTNSLKTILGDIDAIKNNKTIKNVINCILNQIHTATPDDLVRAIYYFLTEQATNSNFDYSNFEAKDYDFSYDDIDPAFCAQFAEQLDGSIGNILALLSALGVANIPNLTTVVNNVLYTDNIISTIATALYKALDGVKLGDMGTLPQVLKLVGVECSTKDFAALLTNKKYGKQFKDAAKVIGAAKNWSKVDASKLKWGVKDQDTFVEALVAILRPLEGVLDVILNSGSLNIYDIVKLPGSNGYESALVPLLEAIGVKGLPSQAVLKKDAAKAYDNLLIDILKPVFNKIGDILKAPVQTVVKMLPAIAYFIANDGHIQAIDNLLTPITALLKAVKPIVNINDLLKALNVDVAKLLSGAGFKTKSFDVYNLQKSLKPILGGGNLLPIINKLVADIKIDGKKLGIKIPAIDWAQLASHGEEITVSSAAMNKQGDFERKTVDGNVGETMLAVIRYVENLLTQNADALSKLLARIDGLKKNKNILKLVTMVFNNISEAGFDEIVKAIFYFFQNRQTDKFFNYTGFQTKANDFSFGDLDEDFCRKLAPMLDGLVNGLLGDKGGLNGLIGGLLYKDELVSKLATGLYGAIEGVKLGDSLKLNQILQFLDLDLSTSNVAKLLTDKKYGKSYAANAAKIKAAGSWRKVNPKSLNWGVKDRATFEQALVAVLRPLYGVLDVLLNDGSLNLANIVSIPGSDGYTSAIVPLLEAFNCINVRTQYQYRMDMSKAYDAILLDVLDPIFDKVEDILNAPIEMVADTLPNLALFFANDGLLQVLDNLLTPVSAILDSLRPIIDVNEVLDILGLDVSALLKKAGLNINVSINLYDLKGTLRPLIGADNIIGLLNQILGIIKIGGNSLGIVLPQVDWLKLASHGEVMRVPSQAATHGTRIMVKADQDETLIAVLRFIIDTINYQGNYDAIVGLLGGLLGGLSDSIAGVVDQVLGMLKGDSDEVILNLVDLLQTIAG